METEKILEYNKLIANWIGWELQYNYYDYDLTFNKEYSDWINKHNIERHLNVEDLKFHIDSNWQLLVLRKISDNLKEIYHTDYSLIDTLKVIQNNYGKPIKFDNLSIFEAIISYIKNHDNVIH